MEFPEFQKRFGSIAVDKGIITKDQLIKALEIQITENIEKGKHKLLGTILYEQGIMTMPQILEVLESMRKTSYLTKGPQPE